MSAVTPLKAHSTRDSFAKLVRFLTNKDVKVEFRGYKPRVETRGDKIIRMVLPELNDNPSKALVDAMHGYLDHECGHIFFTPFKRMADFAEKDRKNSGSRFAITNIIEDIRLEKLLPRDLPGTKENLERMYETFIADLLHPPLKKAIADPNNTPARLATMFMVPAFRALSGQRAFQKFMDDNNYWPHIAPILTCLPNLPRMLREMETFDDVENVVEAIISVIRPPKPEPKDKDDAKGDPDDNESGGPGDEPEDDEDGDSGDHGDAGDDEGNSDEGDDADSGDDAGGGNEDDESGADGDESDDKGEGHGDGDGYDDGEGDEDDDEGSCSGDEEGDKDHKGDSDAGDSGYEPSDDEEGDGPGGKKTSSITDALKQLEPTQRRALYAYKKKRLSIEKIAEQMEMGEEQVKDVLRDARRELKRILDGDPQ